MHSFDIVELINKFSPPLDPSLVREICEDAEEKIIAFEILSHLLPTSSSSSSSSSATPMVPDPVPDFASLSISNDNNNNNNIKDETEPLSNIDFLKLCFPEAPFHYLQMMLKAAEDDVELAVSNIVAELEDEEDPIPYDDNEAITQTEEDDNDSEWETAGNRRRTRRSRSSSVSSIDSVSSQSSSASTTSSKTGKKLLKKTSTNSIASSVISMASSSSSSTSKQGQNEYENEFDNDRFFTPPLSKKASAASLSTSYSSNASLPPTPGRNYAKSSSPSPTRPIQIPQPITSTPEYERFKLMFPKVPPQKIHLYLECAHSDLDVAMTLLAESGLISSKEAGLLMSDAQIRELKRMFPIVDIAVIASELENEGYNEAVAALTVIQESLGVTTRQVNDWVAPTNPAPNKPNVIRMTSREKMAQRGRSGGLPPSGNSNSFASLSEVDCDGSCVERGFPCLWHATDQYSSKNNKTNNDGVTFRRGGKSRTSSGSSASKVYASDSVISASQQRSQGYASLADTSESSFDNQRIHHLASMRSRHALGNGKDSKVFLLPTKITKEPTKIDATGRKISQSQYLSSEAKEYRHKAREAFQHQLDMYKQAATLFRRGGLTGRAAAFYYAEAGRAYRREMVEWNQYAADAIIGRSEDQTRAATQSNNAVTIQGPKISKPVAQIDLHGLTVAEAKEYVTEKVEEWWDQCRNGTTSRKFKIITGKGMHSGGAGAKLRPFFMNYLTKSGWKVDGGDDKGWIFVTGKL